MKLYLTGSYESMDIRTGFGTAAMYSYESLRDAGLDVTCREEKDSRKFDADIEICFNQPHLYEFFSKDGYKIGYTPWESTEIFGNWYWPMSSCDEIWTTSNWCNRVFKKIFPDKKIFTYHHGIDPSFSPKKRKYDKDKPFTFLFIGEPYDRKDGQLVVDTFAKLFGNDPNYRLIIKANNFSKIKVYDKDMPFMPFPPHMVYDNIFLVVEKYSHEELIQLYEEADVFVYPTWGEGFAFNPLQAMAMGIPTIATTEWSDYKKYITVPISSRVARSPWPDIHPGFMYKPDAEDLENAMKNAKSFHKIWAKNAFENSFKIHEEYNWEKVTKPAIQRLEEIYKNL
jgi:glycosyltransferase involved in cell wall biosynthesis